MTSSVLQPGSNRGYASGQLIEQMIVSIWCGAARFAHADITRLDATLVRLFDWGKAAGHKAIVRLFQRFDQGSATRVVVVRQHMRRKEGVFPARRYRYLPIILIYRAGAMVRFLRT